MNLDLLDSALRAGAASAGVLTLLASTSSTTPAEWVERVGFPGACLLAGGWASVRCAKWLGAKVIEPLAQRHVSFMDAIETSTKHQAEALERIERDAAEDRRTARLAIERLVSLMECLGCIEGKAKEHKP